jgi:hypothetical protein
MTLASSSQYKKCHWAPFACSIALYVVHFGGTWRLRGLMCPLLSLLTYRVLNFGTACSRACAGRELMMGGEHMVAIGIHSSAVMTYTL